LTRKLFRFKHLTMVELLRRAIIVWIQLRDGSQLFVGEVRRGLQNVPSNSFSAGRRGERAAVGVVTVKAGQEFFYVHRDRRTLDGFVQLWRNILPKSFQKRIEGASLEENGYNGEVTV